MDRRQFATRAIAGTAAATLASQPVFGNTQGNESIKFPPFGHISLTFRDLVYIPQRLIIVSDNFVHEIGVDLKFQLSNENRSSILNPTLARQFKDGVNIGDVRLVGRDIVVSAVLPIIPGDLRLSDGEISFRINGERLGRPLIGNLPIFGDIPIIGNLFRRKGDTEMKRNLLVFIRPEILDYTE